MRIRGRFSNPLLRRVQRHTRVSTLFRMGGAEPLPVQPGSEQALARPVPAFLPSREFEPVPETVATPLVAPQAVPAAPHAVPAPAPVQTYPAAPILPAPPPAQPPQAAASPAPPPVSSAPPIAVPKADSPKVEEERNWKRLQTILRKHAEKDESLQGQSEAPAPVEATQPPSAPRIEPAEKIADTPASAPVQRRPSVVEELAPAPAERSLARSQPLGREEKTPQTPVPPLKEFASPGEAAVTARPQLTPVPAAASELPDKRMPAQAPILTEKEPLSGLPPHSQPETVDLPKEHADVLPASPQPQQASLLAAEGKQGEQPPMPQNLASAADAPTVQLKRASLKPGLPEEPAEQPFSGEPVPAVDGLSSQVFPEDQIQAEKALAAEPPLVSPAPLQAPPEPARVPSPPALPPVKASLPGQVQLRPAPESAGDAGQAAPAAQPAPPVVRSPVSPPVGEPLAGYLVPQAAPEEVMSAAPLESIWPVQRLPAAVEQPAVPVKPPTPGEPPVVLPHDEQVGQMLQSVAPGLPSESSVELVTPRKPRPSPPVKPAAAQLKPQPPGGELTVEAEQVPSPAVESAVKMPPAVPPGESAATPPKIRPVPTEIGDLPSDLWQLIDQPVPAREAPAIPENPVPARPERRSALQRRLEEVEPVQRAVEQPGTGTTETLPKAKPAASTPPQPEKAEQALPEAFSDQAVFPTDMLEPELPEDVIQRAVEVDELVTEVEAPVEGENSVGASPNVEELAQRVYREIRRRLSVEFERWRRSG